MNPVSLSTAPTNAQPTAQTTENVTPPTALSWFGIGRLLVIVLSYGFIFLGFLCQIGGVGKANKKCEDDEEYDDFEILSCSDKFRYDWWAVFFQLLVALGVAITLVTNTLKDVSMGVSILMAVSISQMIITAEKYLDFRDGGSEFRTASAGFILATMGDMLLALVMGVTEVPTIQMVQVSQLPAMPRRRQPQQQQTEMAVTPQSGGQMGTQPLSDHYAQSKDQGMIDPYYQPTPGDQGRVHQPSPQERFQSLAPHFQGQPQQYGAPPPVPPPVTSPGLPGHRVHP